MKQMPWVYVDGDGTVIYRASSIGNCVVGLTACRLGEGEFPPGEQLRKHMDASSSVEGELLRAVSASLRGELMWEQHEAELKIAVTFDGTDNIINQAVIVRGHIDALHRDSDDIIEAKALGQRNFDKWNSGGIDALGTLGLKYRWQGAVYAHALGRNLRFAIGLKQVADDGTVSIGDLILEPPMSGEDLLPLADIQARIQTVEEHAYNDVYPGCDRQCRPGDGYGHVHVYDAPNMGDNDLLALLEAAQSLDARITELTAERDDIRDTIKATYAPGKHVVGPFTANIIVTTPSRFDSKGFSAAYPDMYEEWKKPGKPVVALRIDDSRKKKVRKDGSGF